MIYTLNFPTNKIVGNYVLKNTYITYCVYRMLHKSNLICTKKFGLSLIQFDDGLHLWHFVKT